MGFLDPWNLDPLSPARANHVFAKSPKDETRKTKRFRREKVVPCAYFFDHFLENEAKNRARGEIGRGPRFSLAFETLSGHPEPRSARAGAGGSRFLVFSAELQKVLFSVFFLTNHLETISAHSHLLLFF